MHRLFADTCFFLLPALLLAITTLITVTKAHSQSLETDLLLIRDEAQTDHTGHTGHTRSSPGLMGRNTLEKYNPASLLLAGTLTMYQRVISPQLSNRCVYHPSCSVFAGEIMRESGMVTGVMLTADRISRCNRLAATDVPPHRIDFERGLINDETARYHK